MKSGQVRRLGILWCGAVFIYGCAAGSAAPGDPLTANEANAAAQNRPIEAAPPVSEEKPEAGPCPDAPQPTLVLEAAEAVSGIAQEADEFLKHLGTPPSPAAPYTPERAKEWRETRAQPWFDAQLVRVSEFERALGSFPEGTYAGARATVIIAALYDYVSKRKTVLPKPAEKYYDVRVAYYSDFARARDKLLSEVAESWLARARKAASEWGMFELGIERAWLTGDAGRFLREPFVVSASGGALSPLLPASVAWEISTPGFPASGEEVLQLGPYGLTPRQLACAERYVSDQRVAHVLGRYYTTRALLFRDDAAARRAEELLAEEKSPAAIVDRALLGWLRDTATPKLRAFDQAEVRSWFDSLPPADLSRTRLTLNLLSGYGNVPRVGDQGPEPALLPPGERPKAAAPQMLTDFYLSGTQSLTDKRFSWWTVPRQPPGGGAGSRIEGILVELGDGGHFIIPYSDQGLDMCSMVQVAPDGQRTPHRPPDVKNKCAVRWREQDAAHEAK